MRFNILVLTDHRGHSKENSLYALALAMSQHTLCDELFVASRGNPANDSFFFENQETTLEAYRVSNTFQFEESGDNFIQHTQSVNISSFDFIFLRLPRPIPEGFFSFLARIFSPEKIINNPLGIDETGNKKFLINFSDLCPPIQLCHSISDILEFAAQFPIVLKPLENYGGKGVVKLENHYFFQGNEKVPFDTYLPTLNTELEKGGYLAMEFLKNVGQGDKRILVVNGNILGASLRLPAEGSWLCNVAQGGSSRLAEADADEQKIIEQVSPILLKKGILMFGADTLVDNKGKRVLSEINTLSIGGFPQAAQQSKRPIVQQAIDLIFTHFQFIQ